MKGGRERGKEGEMEVERNGGKEGGWGGRKGRWTLSICETWLCHCTAFNGVSVCYMC